MWLNDLALITIQYDLKYFDHSLRNQNVVFLNPVSLLCLRSSILFEQSDLFVLDMTLNFVLVHCPSPLAIK